MNCIKNKRGKYPAGGMMAAFAILFFYAVQLHVPVISDETVTMANAAWVTGNDWSLMVGALGGYYYRYAQALMTVPFFAFLDNPALIYCFSMILNALMHASIVPVVYVIGKKYMKITSDMLAILLAFAACFVPASVLYIYYYRGDLLLGILPWYVLLAFLESIKASDQQKRKQRFVCTILMVVFCVLAYMSHTRGIVLIIALIMTDIAVRIWMKKKAICWPVFVVLSVILFKADSMIGTRLKDALYWVSGLQANAFESTDMGSYFDIFSLRTLKGIILMCLGWLQTLIATTDGLVLIGVFVCLIVVFKMFVGKKDVTNEEKTAVLFSALVFIGYYIVGALFFKDTYIDLRTGDLQRRVDRLLYDRYAICGASMIIYWALYAMCIQKEWMKLKAKVACVISGSIVFVIFVWKLLPIAVKYTGYVYNTIILNTFQTVEAADILSGAYYNGKALILINILGLLLMVLIFILAGRDNARNTYFLLILVLISDLFFIHVNFLKIRKASNDYVVESTEAVVDYMSDLDETIREKYPYILKGGLSGVKIQFYQSQLPEYIMFGKKQEKQLALDNYFIICDDEDLSYKWYDNDYFGFKTWDYANTPYDSIYVKGEELKTALEESGYQMIKLVPEE